MIYACDDGRRTSQAQTEKENQSKQRQGRRALFIPIWLSVTKPDSAKCPQIHSLSIFCLLDVSQRSPVFLIQSGPLGPVRWSQTNKVLIAGVTLGRRTTNIVAPAEIHLPLPPCQDIADSQYGGFFFFPLNEIRATLFCAPSASLPT